MRFENEFEVAGRPAEIIDKFSDLPLLASFLPGASVGPASPDGSHPGTLVVSFGPKRIAFKGTLTNTVDRAQHAGLLSGHASADVRGAKMAVRMHYSLKESAGSKPPRTRVAFISEAQLTGVLAEFGKTGGGVVVANAVLAEFARRFSAQFEPAEGQVPTTDAAPATLSAMSLLAEVFRSMWRAIGKAASKLGALFARREG